MFTVNADLENAINAAWVPIIKAKDVVATEVSEIKNVEIDIEVKENTETVAPVVEKEKEEVKEKKYESVIKMLLENNKIAEIDGVVTKVKILGVIGDEIYILPNRALKTDAGFNWKVILCPLVVDDKIVVNSKEKEYKVDLTTINSTLKDFIDAYNSEVPENQNIVSVLEL